MLGVPKATFASSGPVKQAITPGGSGQAAIRNFCSECGSLLFGTPQSAPELVTIYAGGLDDATSFRPSQALFVGQRPPWAELAIRLVEYPAHPGG